MINCFLISIISYLIYKAITILNKSKCENCYICQNCDFTFSKTQKDDILSKNPK